MRQSLFSGSVHLAFRLYTREGSVSCCISFFPSWTLSFRVASTMPIISYLMQPNPGTASSSFKLKTEKEGCAHILQREMIVEQYSHEQFTRVTFLSHYRPEPNVTQQTDPPALKFVSNCLPLLFVCAASENQPGPHYVAVRPGFTRQIHNATESSRFKTDSIRFHSQSPAGVCCI